MQNSYKFITIKHTTQPTKMRKYLQFKCLIINEDVELHEYKESLRSTKLVTK